MTRPGAAILVSCVLASIATFGPDGTNEPINSTSVTTSASVEEFNEQIDALRRAPRDSEGTSWDRGLGHLVGMDYDMALFVTDGKPTACGVPGSEQGNTGRATRTDQVDIDSAIESANALKSKGTKVIGSGLGSEANEGNIKPVSGRTAGDYYYVISDYAELAEQLCEIATKSCRGTLNVTQLIDPGAGEHADSTAKHSDKGWTTSSAESAGGMEKTTDSAGTVSFKLTTPAEVVRASEQPQEGYRLQQQSGSNAVFVADGRDVVARTITDGFEPTETVDAEAIITCRIVNDQIPGGLSWKKVDEAAGQFEVTDLAWDDYTITETRAPDGYVLMDETQTVAITGEKRDVAFSDLVNKKKAHSGADPVDGASADPSADGTPDPEADDSAATESNSSTVASGTFEGGSTSADGCASDSGGDTSVRNDTGGNDSGSDGSQLPRTGAAGAMAFGLLGVLLIGGGVATILISGRRKTGML